MADPIDLAAHRFGKKGPGPNNYTAEEALASALADVRAGKINPKHVVICIAEIDEENDKLLTEYRQGGSYNRHGQAGLVSAVHHALIR